MDTKLPDFMSELKICNDILNETSTCKNKNAYLEVLKRTRYQLIQTINKVPREEPEEEPVSPLTTKLELHRKLFQLEYETEQVQTKIRYIRKEWMKQQEALAKLQETLFVKNRNLCRYGNYCAEQGHTLISIITKITEEKHLVELFLDEMGEDLLDFIKIVDGCLYAFARTCGAELPLTSSFEFKYMMSLCSCIYNISTESNGSKFLTNFEECRKMLDELITTLHSLTDSTMDSLKVTMLGILQNLSGQENGKKYLQENHIFLETLGCCVYEESNKEILKPALEILETFTNEVITQDFLLRIIKAVNLDELESLCICGSGNVEIGIIVSKIFRNIDKIKDYYANLKKLNAGGTLDENADFTSLDDEVLQRRKCKCKRSRLHPSNLTKKTSEEKIDVVEKELTTYPPSENRKGCGSKSCSREIASPGDTLPGQEDKELGVNTSVSKNEMATEIQTN